MCIAFLRLLRGRIKIGALQSNRIGHLAGNVEVHLCERDAGIRPKIIEWWCTPWPCCNNYLLKMWRRVINIDRTGFLNIVWKVNRLLPGWQSIEIPTDNLDRDVHNLYERFPKHLKFTTKEKLRGLVGLCDLGLPPNAKWVCLMVRDSAYLPHLDYHRHRDSDIDSYMPAVESLVKRGYYVIRMGAKVAKPMPYTSDKVIDYANSSFRSDFMDLYLCAKCVFALNNGTGLDAVVCAFRKPSCYVNFVPIEYLATWNVGSLAIWKHHMKDGKRMTPAEIFGSGAGQFMRADEYEKAGITLVDNTPKEIMDAALEMEMMLGDYFRFHNDEPLDDNDGKQKRFWRDFPRSISPYTRTPIHGEIRMRIGQEFLRGYAQ